MTIHDYLAALKRHWVVILVLGVVGAAAGYGYSQYVPEQYRAEASVIVIPTRGESTTELVQGSNYVQNLVQTYTVLATSPTVLDPVISELGLDDTAKRLADRIDVSAPLNTVIIEIGVTDGKSKVARDAANAIASQLATAVGDLSPTGADDLPAVRVETISPAQPPRYPVSPNTKLNMAIGALVGLAVGVVFALVRRRFGSRVTTAQDVLDATSVPLIGEVLQSGGNRTLPAAVLAGPDGRASESLRHLTASLKFLEVDNPRRVVLLTSASPSEGKTSVSLALALTLAEIGNRVLYIEADLRRPSAATYTQLEGSVGLTTVLIGDIALSDAVQVWGHTNMHVLTSGTLPPNPGELVASGQLHAVVKEARAAYDYVIVDTAPVLSVSDALWLADEVDAVLIAVRAGSTRRSDLQRALAAVQNAHQPHLGIVLNDVKRTERSPYYAHEIRKARRAAARRATR